MTHADQMTDEHDDVVEIVREADRSEQIVNGMCLIAAGALGMVSAPFWPLLFPIIGFALQRGEQHIAFVRRYGPAMGKGEAWGLITCAALARAGLYCLAAYGAGSVLAAVWSLL